MELFVGAWVVSMLVGAMLGAMRGNVVYGLIWPLALGPIGLLLTFWLLKDERETVSRP